MKAAGSGRGGTAGRGEGARSGRARIVIHRAARGADVRRRPLRLALERLLLDHGLEGALCVALVDDAAIARLHGDFLDDGMPTDVLTFPQASPGRWPAGGEEILGDIVISVETARREARRRGLAVERELALYAIHGALHLAGLDDREPRERRRMRRRERIYLRLYDSLTPRSRSSRRPGGRRPDKRPPPAPGRLPPAARRSAR